MQSLVTPVSSVDAQNISTGRFKPLVSLKKHRWLALFIIVAVTAIGLPIAFILGKTVYTTTAVVMVSPRFVQNLDTEKGMDLSRDQYQLYVKQQEHMITRLDILQEALQRPEIKSNWLRPDETEAAGLDRLSRAISETNDRGTPFINISLTSTKDEGLDTILNGIIQVYLKRSQEESLYSSDERIDMLQQRRDELLELIAQRQKQRSQIAEELGVTTFKEDNLNPYDNILIESTQAQIQARRLRVQAETRFHTLTEGKTGETVLDAQIREMVANDAALKDFKAKQIEQRTNLMTQLIGLTPQHPTRQRAEQEIAKIDRDIQQATDKLVAEIRGRLLAQNQSEVYKTQRLEGALSEETKIQRNQTNHYSTLYNHALVLNKEIERAYKQLDKIDDRVDFLTIESSAPGFVRLDTPAGPPDSAGKRKKLLLLFLVAALGMGVSVPVMIDLLDRRLQTTGEVHKVLGFAPMAWILERKDRATEQLALDHLRRLALALKREYQNHQTSYFVLTSIKAGGGATTLTLELAHSLSDLGVRTLAMELNAFKPDSRFSTEWSSHGVSTLLNPNTPRSLAPETLVLPATEELPARLPVGETPSRHLTTHGKLQFLLEQLHTRYDMIIIDTPPILLSADAELLGEIAGGVLMVIEAGHITPGELKRAASLLERLNPPVVGAILNRVKVYEGGGYFAELLKEYSTGTKLKSGWLKRWLWS